MGKGKEYQQQINEALDAFETAIVRREQRSLLESKVPLQQEVDRARAKVLEVVAKVVAAERLEKESAERRPTDNPARGTGA
jgi:hypothetical protein